MTWPAGLEPSAGLLPGTLLRDLAGWAGTYTCVLRWRGGVVVRWCACGRRGGARMGVFGNVQGEITEMIDIYKNKYNVYQT